MDRDIVVTTDGWLTDEYAQRIHQRLLAWKAEGGPLIIAGEGIHVAVRQGDGTWVRVCHDHATSAPDQPDV